MKLINILFYLFIFVFMCMQISAQNTNPEVTNAVFSITGTTVTVTYDVSDAEQGSVTIIMQVSSDGGTTWDYNYGTASGEIGAGKTTGTGKTITWTYSGGYAENFIIKIIANDETAGGSPCPGTPTVTYDGKTYNTVLIGDQCWLKENLDVGTRIDGNQNQTNNDPNYIEKYCYEDNTSNCDTYGGLYQWDEAMKYVTNESAQGICPSGWHIPTLAEFQTLSDAVGSSSNALKAVGQGIGGGAGTNTSGFSALIAGYLDNSGFFYNLGILTYIWSSTVSGATSAYTLYLFYSLSGLNLVAPGRDNGFSVRCLKDY